jgi:hypothetical protein
LEDGALLNVAKRLINDRSLFENRLRTVTT